MWSSFVSFADAVLNHAIFRFIEIIWRYPLVGAAFLGTFLVLSALLWLEVLKDASAKPADEPRPISLRR